MGELIIPKLGLFAQSPKGGLSDLILTFSYKEKEFKAPLGVWGRYNIITDSTAG